MWGLLQRTAHANRRTMKSRSKAQSLVEFTLISMILFFFLFGIIEAARMMFMFSQVTSAAEEGVRWGIFHPLQVISHEDDQGSQSYPTLLYQDVQPCNIVSQAMQRVTLIPTHGNPNLHVYVSYDGGAAGVPVTHPIGWNATSADFVPGKDRVVVHVVYDFHFLVGILDDIIPNGLAVQMKAARTIQINEQIQPPEPVTCPEDLGS